MNTIDTRLFIRQLASSFNLRIRIKNKALLSKHWMILLSTLLIVLQVAPYSVGAKQSSVPANILSPCPQSGIMFSRQTGVSNPLNSVDMSARSTPTFVDIDNDGDKDAFVGSDFAALINYYENVGSSTAPVFSSPVPDPSGLDVPYFDSTPAFVDIDGDGDFDAFSGEGNGSIRYYENTGTASSFSFQSRTGSSNPLDLVINGNLDRTAPTFVDIDNDQDYDAFIGNEYGTIYFYRNVGTSNIPIFEIQAGSNNPLDGVDVGVRSKPVFFDINADGDMDAFIGNEYGTVGLFENTGDATTPVFQQCFNGAMYWVDTGFESAPAPVDMDGDGDPDVFIGELDGTIQYFRNEGADSDMDELLDENEATLETDPLDPDSDDDGVLDGEEVNLYNTDPLDKDSDGDTFSDGLEIEMETDPLESGSFPQLSRSITYSDVVQDAFSLSQTPYEIPLIQDISVLDPPIDGDLESVGLVFEESNRILPINLISKDSWYALARPRASLDKLRFRIYIDSSGNGTYDLKTYSDAAPEYSHPVIQPPIDASLIPAAGRVLSRFIIGHDQAGVGSPQFFDISASGYIRFNGLSPQTVGSSYRVALLNVFSIEEEFPRFKELDFVIRDENKSNLFSLIDSESFTGVASLDLTPAEESIMHVSASFFPRRDIPVSEEMGLVGYSSMFWKNEDDSPENEYDEAHDCDVLIVGYDRDQNGIVDKIVEFDIDNPASYTRIDFAGLQAGNQIYFALENRDRNPVHYQEYSSAGYETRSSYSIQLLSSDVPVSLVLHESPTNSEYVDNIVINLAAKSELPRANSIGDAISVEYITKAYLPMDKDADGLTDQLEKLVGTDIYVADTDNDGDDDHLELLQGTNPLLPPPTPYPGVISHARDFSTPFVPPNGMAVGMLPILTKSPLQVQSEAVTLSTPIMPPGTPEPFNAKTYSTPRSDTLPDARDELAPETTLLVTPSFRSRQRSAFFAYSSTEAGRFICSLDGSSYFECGSSIRFVGLDEGMHTFEVRAVDHFGKFDDTPEIHTWIIEKSTVVQRYRATN